ncbi:hypothetical protein CFC21_059516 [Triticum aestivum]|uniref:Uncharacterized protein n=2 Tax=Triticum aestivum TaxID=4565 RepID=A0A3B6IZN8_WHEAT|nr:uncharacterized protein LOC123093839 [Triticum aestivum]KAF7051262.1 hypothetical protein CFC21_059516 [Triticum aestivum]
MDLKLDDLDWEEVRSINCYALFMGYLSMAIRGMGYLVLTWSTVVLLGGFVSVLENKDFWCLTIITLVQTAGVFDVSLKEKMRYIGTSRYGLQSAIYAMLIWKNTNGDGKNANGDGPSVPRLVVVLIVWLVHLLVVAVILLPLSVLYLCGLLFTTGISVWRLIQRDYGRKAEDGYANLQPALNVLYSLALFQGSLFCYRLFSSFAREGLASEVAEKYKMNGRAHKSVKKYLRETMIGCEKDPSFVKGRNLVTYAVGMMKSESSKSFLSGARILDALLEHPLPLEEQHALIAELVGSASSTHVLEKLLQALDSRSPHDEKMRGVAANIVAHLAGKIRLKRFPRGIQCIGSLLEISQGQAEDGDECAPSADYDYKKLMEKGLVILDGLAADEHNCRVLGNAEGLLAKVVAPVSSDLLHLIDHDAWSIVVAASLQVMCRLVAAPGETGAKLRSQISSNKEAINSMEGILKCDECDEKLQVLTIKILTQLPMDVDVCPTAVNTESRGNFVKILPDIFTCDSKDSSIRKLAGEALVMLSLNQSNAAIILKANDNVVQDLTKILLDAEADSTHRINAAETLEHLYVHYKENDDHHKKKLKEAMEGMMRKVLPKILSFGSKNNTTPTEKGTEKDVGPLLGTGDVEAQDGDAPQDDGRDNNTSACPHNDDKHVGRKLHAALLSLATAIFDKLTSQNHDLAQLVNTISPGDYPTSFAIKLNVMVKANSDPTVSCLRIMKNTSRMVVLMMKHNGNYLKQHLVSFHDLIDSLSTACKKMACLEGSMIFYSSNRGAMKPGRTLASLVKEAEELLGQKEPKRL